MARISSGATDKIVTPDEERFLNTTAEDASGISSETIERLESEPPLRQYLVEKYAKESKRNWDLFYKRHTTNFFKDRHWLMREFPELAKGTLSAPKQDVSTDSEVSAKSFNVLEVGCGVGNAVFPMLEDFPNTFVHCCDLSPRAVEFVRNSDEYNAARCNAFQCDIVHDNLTDNVPPASINCVTMLFVLSAISPGDFKAVVDNLKRVLAPGGLVLFRDYGLFDHAMIRFKPGHKLAENFYVRQDGTRAYFFTKDELQALFEQDASDGSGAKGFETVACHYVQKETSNRKMGICVPRIFVQGKFRMPANTPVSTPLQS